MSPVEVISTGMCNNNYITAIVFTNKFTFSLRELQIKIKYLLLQQLKILNVQQSIAHRPIDISN